MYFPASIAIVFSTAIIGMMINNSIKTKKFYRKLSYLNFIRNETANKYLGVTFLKYLVTNTPLGISNPLLKLTKGRPDIQALRNLRNEMTNAEISHLIAFAITLLIAVYCLITRFHEKIFVPLLIMNVLYHFYPPLVQQYNKRRLDQILERFSTKK